MITRRSALKGAVALAAVPLLPALAVARPRKRTGKSLRWVDVVCRDFKEAGRLSAKAGRMVKPRRKIMKAQVSSNFRDGWFRVLVPHTFHVWTVGIETLRKVVGNTSYTGYSCIIDAPELKGLESNYPIYAVREKNHVTLLAYPEAVEIPLYAVDGVIW